MPGTKDEETVSPFTLKNAGDNFAGRSTDIFGSLKALEEKHLDHEKSRTDTEEYANLNPTDDDAEANSNNTKRGGGCSATERNADVDRSSGGDKDDEDVEERGRKSHGRETVPFRAPRGRAPTRRGGGGSRGRVPDHGIRPQGWTYYNLEDVARSDMSEKSNTQAALAFLDERRKLREGQQEEERFDAGSAACSKGLFSFAKRSKKSAPESGDTDAEHKSSHSSVSATVSSSSVVEESKEETFDSDVLQSKDKDSEDASGEKEKETSVEKEEETSATSNDSSLKESSAQALSFKSRKGIKRSIRSRDADDD